MKGGFSGGEDYRWAYIRKWYPGWKFGVFNFVFICFFQQLIILAFTVPAVAALQNPTPLQPLDFVAAGVYLLLVLGEAVADAQMYCFQTEKYRRKNAKEPLGEYSRGFIESGFWGFSRHPNYFCEVTLWWVFYLFAVSCTGTVLHWTGLGAVLLTSLFVPPGASLDVTETLSSRKYPAYPEYQAAVSRFIPWFPSKAKKTA
jgi:steroid 5-alpha reductase family enzyme